MMKGLHEPWTNKTTTNNSKSTKTGNRLHRVCQIRIIRQIGADQIENIL